MPCIKSHGNYIVDHGKSWKNHGIVFLNLCGNPVIETLNEPWHGISNIVVCAISKASDQPAHTRSLIRAFASRLNIL